MTGAEAAELAQKLPFPVLIVVLGFVLLWGFQQIRKKEVAADGAEAAALAGVAVKSTDGLIRAHDRELVREREFGDMKARLAVLEEQIKALTMRADGAERREQTLQLEVNRIGEELTTERRDKATLQLEVNRISSELAAEKERNTALVQENNDLRKQVGELETRLRDVQEKLARVTPDTNLEPEKELS